MGGLISPLCLANGSFFWQLKGGERPSTKQIHLAALCMLPGWFCQQVFVRYPPPPGKASSEGVSAEILNVRLLLFMRPECTAHISGEPPVPEVLWPFEKGGGRVGPRWFRRYFNNFRVPRAKTPTGKDPVWPRTSWANEMCPDLWGVPKSRRLGMKMALES